MVRDPYAVLGLKRSADPSAVKAAYRRLAKRYHPDLHPGDPVAARRMNAVNEAYEVIRSGRVPEEEDPYAPAENNSRSAQEDPYDRTASGRPGDYRGEPEDDWEAEDAETDPWRIFFGAGNRRAGAKGPGGTRFAKVFFGVLIVFTMAALFFFVSSVMRRKIATSPSLPSAGEMTEPLEEEDPFDAAWDAATTQAPYGGGYYAYDAPKG